MKVKSTINYNQIILGHSRFLFDYERQQVIDFEDQRNMMPFSSFKLNGAGERCINYKGCDIQIRLPEILFKAPFGDNEILIKAINSTCAKKGFRLVDEAMRLRLDNGVLPKLKIADAIWTADALLYQISDTDSHGGVISLKDMVMDKNKEYHLLEYDKLNKKQSNLKIYELIDMPQNIAIVTFPNVDIIDPVGCARREGLSDTHYLVEIPVIAYHTAKMIPLEQTPIHKVIKQNRKRKGLPVQKAPKESRKRRGKGLS
jgi:hypothetical protein